MVCNCPPFPCTRISNFGVDKKKSKNTPTQSEDENRCTVRAAQSLEILMSQFREAQGQSCSSKHATHSFKALRTRTLNERARSEATVAQINVKNLDRLYSCNSQVRQNRRDVYDVCDVGHPFGLW